MKKRKRLKPHDAHDYPIAAGDYTRAGEASADIKRRSRQLGVRIELLRRVAVASYELELNLVIHSHGGNLMFEIDSECVRLSSSDRVTGHPRCFRGHARRVLHRHEEARSLGFGAGMGLLNMKRNADVFQIESELGRGTDINMLFEPQ